MLPGRAGNNDEEDASRTRNRQRESEIWNKAKLELGACAILWFLTAIILIEMNVGDDKMTPKLTGNKLGRACHKLGKKPVDFLVPVMVTCPSCW